MELSRSDRVNGSYKNVRQERRLDHLSQQNGHKEGAYRKPISVIEHATVSGYPPPEPRPDYDDPDPEVATSGGKHWQGSPILALKFN